MPERHSRSGIDGSLSFLMQVSSGSVVITMLSEEAAHVADRCFEVRHEALAPQKRHRFVAVNRIDVRDRTFLALRNAIEPSGGGARPWMNLILKVGERLGRLTLRLTHWHLAVLVAFR